VNESLVKYLAGLLDADGSLSFAFKEDPNRSGLYFVGLHLRLSSSKAVDHGHFVDSLPTETGMGGVYYSGATQQFKTWLVAKRADLEMLLPRLIKHMVIKGKHWNWLLDQWRNLRADGKAVDAALRDEMTEASKRSRVENVGPLKPKNHPTWAWTAGYLDGDGCYAYRKQNNSCKGWVMHVSAVAHVNDICVLEFLQKAFGGSFYEQGQSADVKIWRRSIGYQNRSFALSFLPSVVKHSRLKKHKIEAIIHHHRQRLSVQGAKAQAIV
jgi:hypothetical protein